MSFQEMQPYDSKLQYKLNMLKITSFWALKSAYIVLILLVYLCFKNLNHYKYIHMVFRMRNGKM